MISPQAQALLRWKWPRLMAAAALLLALCSAAGAAPIEIIGTSDTGNTTEFTVKTQVLIIMTLLGLLPILALMMTCFTRFVIILALLRQADGVVPQVAARLGDTNALINQVETALANRPKVYGGNGQVGLSRAAAEALSGPGEDPSASRALRSWPPMWPR